MKNALIVVDLKRNVQNPKSPLNKKIDRIGWIVNEVMGTIMGRGMHLHGPGSCFDVLIFANSDLHAAKGTIRLDRLRHNPEIFRMESGASAFSGRRSDPAPWYPEELNRLDLYLRDHKKVSRVAFFGIVDCGSLAATALDAKNVVGLETFLVEDAVMGSNPQELATFFAELEMAGIQRITSDEIIRSWYHEDE